MADTGLKDRRLTAGSSPSHLRAQLNEAQLMTLGELERFGWEVQFIRRPLFQEPVAVVVDGDRKHHAVLRPDGELDESSGLSVRTR